MTFEAAVMGETSNDQKMELNNIKPLKSIIQGDLHVIT